IKTKAITEPSGEATAEMIRRALGSERGPVADQQDAHANEPTAAEIAAARTKAIGWLVAQQNQDGGWGQGEESRHMQRGNGQHEMRDPSNVGDTAASVLALLRTGSTPLGAIHKLGLMEQPQVDRLEAILRGLDYLLAAVEAHESNDLYITDLRGTRLQSKLGPYVDTFLTAVTLTEALDHEPEDAHRARITAALEKIVDKIEANQRADGGFGGGGWANALSVSLSNQALNGAVLRGIAVEEEVLGRTQQAAAGSDAVVGGRFAARGDSAGIELYAAAKAVSGTAANDVALRESVAVSAPQMQAVALEAGRVADALERDGESARAEELRRASAELVVVADGSELDDDSARKQADAAGVLRQAMDDASVADAWDRVAGEVVPATTVASRLDMYNDTNARFRENAFALVQTRGAVVSRLQDQRFVAGFGSDGGEEYLSYMKIGEGLAADADAEEALGHFVKAMRGNLARVQNNDGSWTGHHCITGRNFCTATALMVMTLDEWAVGHDHGRGEG
ncbi:MAG: prenyltransferase/squalene oxidase repeat-containing protein, partial [Planctomycetota bacterium]